MAFNRISHSGRHLWSDRRPIVLVADPDADIRCMMQQLTPPDRYRVEEADSAGELLERLRWSEVALVVVDVSYLHADPILLQHLSFRSRLGVRIIVTSTGENASDELAARNLGCALYAPKPCGYWMLQQAAANVLCGTAGVAGA